MIFDFNQLHSEESAQGLKDELDKLDIDVSILVNNVGILPNSTLDKAPIGLINAAIRININS